jgi:hypothetical protein
MAYTKLFSHIVTSSIWTEDDQTRIIWITMMALADKRGEVMASVPGLARVAGVPIPAVEKALDKFLSPDEYSRTPDEQGRRIEKIDGGWSLINHAKHRRMASVEEQKERNAERQRKFRERQDRNKKSNASITPSNDAVTVQIDNAEAEAEAEAEADTESTPNGVSPEASDKPKTSTPASRKRLSDGEFLEKLPEHYPAINIPSELKKMDAWLMTRPGKQKTQRFIVAWLNRIDTPVTAGASETKPKGKWDW